MISATLTDVPAHVPKEIVFDFDMFSPPGFVNDPHIAWKRVQDEFPDIFWTPRYGGHWVMTRADDIKHAQQNYAEFSNHYNSVPPGLLPLKILVTQDPPEHTPLRRFLMPAFMPKAVREIQDKARATAVELITQIAPRGHCQFVDEFAGIMPVVAFLTLMGLPTEDAAMLRSTVVPHNSGEWPTAQARRRAYILEHVERRRQNPDDKLLSKIVHGSIDGVPFTEVQILELVFLLLGGGLDTVAATTTWIARFLATHPGHRKQLMDEPKLIPAALEEFSRRFGVSNLGRMVKSDMTYKGFDFRGGEMILLPFPLVGLDERLNPDPMTVDFKRRAQHANFGTGPHTCPGAVLARAEIRIFIEEWLKVIPDFRIKDGTDIAATTGIINNASALYLEWDPKSIRLGSGPVNSLE